MSEPIYLAEIEAWDPNTRSTRTLYFSTGRGFTSSPSDTPANTYYAPNLLQPVDVVRTMFSPGATMGRSTATPGDLILSNGDGELDFILGLGLDGRVATVRRSIVPFPRSVEDDFTYVFTGTMDQPELRADVIAIALFDRLRDLNVALQPTKYAGTNSLPSGLEGVEGDLKGKPKPLCFGVAKNIDPPCVNTTRLIYQVNDGAVASIDGVYDQGLALSAGAAYSSQSDMETNAPLAGQYRVWLAGGYFRLGSTPGGLITADVTQGSSAAVRTAGQLFNTLLQRAREVNEWVDPLGEVLLATNAGDTLVTSAGDDIVAYADLAIGDVEDLDAADNSEIGFWTKEEMTIAAACDLVANTPHAWWGVDREGLFRIRQFVAPDIADAVVVFTENDLLRPLERIAPNDPGRGIPAYRQIVQWGRNHVTQATDLNSSVTNARRALLRSEWRESVAEDASIQEDHLLSPEVRRSSLYSLEADAAAEASRRLELYRPRRDCFEILVALDDETAVIDLGDVVALNHSRYGLSIVGSEDGLPFVVIGVAPDARAGRLTLTLWGGSAGMENLVTQEEDGGDYLVTSAGEYLITQAAA